MPDTGLACPDCDNQGKTTKLMSSPGRGFSCENGHKWDDTETLMAARPRQISTPKLSVRPPTEQTELRLMLKPALAEALQVRFKEKLNNSAAALFGIMLDPEAFVVVGDDARRLQQHLGQKIPHADALVGSVYALKMDRDEWKTKAEQKVSAEAASAAPPNDIEGDFVQLSLRLSADQFSFIYEKSKFNNVTPAKYLQNCINTAIENNWF